MQFRLEHFASFIGLRSFPSVSGGCGGFHPPTTVSTPSNPLRHSFNLFQHLFQQVKDWGIGGEIGGVGATVGTYSLEMVEMVVFRHDIHKYRTPLLIRIQPPEPVRMFLPHLILLGLTHLCSQRTVGTVLERLSDLIRIFGKDENNGIV